jgi:hypothetical protein
MSQMCYKNNTFRLIVKRQPVAMAMIINQPTLMAPGHLPYAVGRWRPEP